MISIKAKDGDQNHYRTARVSVLVQVVLTVLLGGLLLGTASGDAVAPDFRFKQSHPRRVAPSATSSLPVTQEAQYALTSRTPDAAQGRQALLLWHSQAWMPAQQSDAPAILPPSHSPQGGRDRSGTSRGGGAEWHSARSLQGHSHPSHRPEGCGQWARFTLLFLHFQKCGGTTVELALQALARQCKLTFVRSPEPRTVELLRSGKVDILTGHITYGMHKFLPKKQRYLYVAVFRDPVERAVSQYNHNGRQKCSGCPLLEFCLRQRNYYTKFLLGESRRGLGTTENMRRKVYDVERAKQILTNRVALTGLTTHLSAWWGALGSLLQEHVGLRVQLPALGFANVRSSQTVPTQAKPANVKQCAAGACEALSAEDLQTAKVNNEEDYAIWHLAQILAANQTNLPSYEIL